MAHDDQPAIRVDIPSIFLYAAIAIGVHLVFILSQTTSIPKARNTWWGPGKRVEGQESIQRFRIQISDKVLDDLQERLSRTIRFPPPLQNAKFHYGMNTDHLKMVLKYWLTRYDWREREEYLNKYPQYKTSIAGLGIHYIHAKPQLTKNANGTPDVVPLLMLHGWPGSVREFYSILPLLTRSRDESFVFEVICPSMPGFVFSDATTKQGLGAPEVAVMMRQLMRRLGFHKFFVQGGGFGAIVADYMALLYPDSVRGLHSNMCTAPTIDSTFSRMLLSLWPSMFFTDLHLRTFYPLSRTYGFLLEESGYFHIQATKPDTIGVALSDSPAGLAAYILEKFSTWTDPTFTNRSDGGLSIKYNLDSLLDNIMFYWVTSSITTSMRLYSETFNKKYFEYDFGRFPIKVPTACAVFPNDALQMPRLYLRGRYINLIQYSNMPRGGHFAAFEEPRLLAKDIWEFVALVRNATCTEECDDCSQQLSPYECGERTLKIQILRRESDVITRKHPRCKPRKEIGIL